MVPGTTKRRKESEYWSMLAKKWSIWGGGKLGHQIPVDKNLDCRRQSNKIRERFMELDGHVTEIPGDESAIPFAQSNQ